MKRRVHRFFYLRIVLICHLSFVICHLSFSQLIITPTIIHATCPTAGNGSASVSVSGGTSPYTYQWLPDGQTSPTITGLVPGTYSVIITDNAGNDSTVSYVVGPSPIQDDPQLSCSIKLNPTGGTPPYTFNWSNGSASSFVNVGRGNYSVVITDANNCTATFSYDIAEDACFVSPASYFTPNDDCCNNTWQITNAQYFDNAHVIVFDRWGTRVHEQKGTYEPWDGKSYFGIPVPDAVYYYFFYQDKDDKQKESKHGSVTILR